MRQRPLRWHEEIIPVPKHPYRDSAIFYAVLALVVVGLALLTGGGVMRAIVIAVAFFVLATAWSWYRWRERLAGAGDAEREMP